MNTQEPSPPAPEYRCPGQQHPISRAVHLGRLAAFYPACRQCSHRDDTGTLSPRQVEQLQAVQSSSGPRSLFHEEGVGGVYLNDLTPVAARQIAAAFGIWTNDECRMMNDELPSKGGGRRAEGGEPSIHHSSFIIHHSPSPSLLLAGDGRPITAEITAAVGEGVRWSGCNAIDIGPATAACMAFAVQHFQAAGGILVGNHGQQPHIVGLQFWAGSQPLSLGGSLEPIIARYQSGVDRPARGFGTLSRAAADAPYLAALAEHYHALRPLRVVVDSASRPLVEYLAKLTAAVACEVIPCRVTPHDLPEQIRTDAAHFGVCVDGDGETCRVLDEQGRAVSAERLLLLLADGHVENVEETRHAHDKREHGTRPLSAVSVVLENGISLPVIQRLEQHGVDVVMSSSRRAEMAATMHEHGAIVGGGPSGRFWFTVAGVPLPDALMAITRLLVILSRSDAPLSVVLDRDAPLG